MGRGRLPSTKMGSFFLARTLFLLERRLGGPLNFFIANPGQSQSKAKPRDALASAHLTRFLAKRHARGRSSPKLFSAFYLPVGRTGRPAGSRLLVVAAATAAVTTATSS